MSPALNAAGSPEERRAQYVLSEDQIERLIAAVEGRNDLVASLHKLSPEQEAVIDAINKVGNKMGVKNFAKPIALPTKLARRA